MAKGASDAVTPLGGSPPADSREALVALLRGVNVGGRNRVPMADLRRIVERLGFCDVRTHLQSGNVVFAPDPDASGVTTEPDAVGGLIEEALSEELGLTVPVLVRTAADIKRVVAGNPLSEVATDHSRLVVAFLSGPVSRVALEAIDPAGFFPDRFAAGEREIYVWAPNGVSETKLTHAFWEKRLGLTATARNWRTVERLLELAGG